MSVDLGRPFPPAISSRAPLQERYDNLKEQVNVLASWILNNCPEEIGRGNPREGEGACEVALRLMREWKIGLAREIAAERARQDAKWGGPEHDDGHGWWDWDRFIQSHLDEAAYQNNGSDWDIRRKALIEIAALAVAAVESLDRKSTGEVSVDA